MYQNCHGINQVNILKIRWCLACMYSILKQNNQFKMNTITLMK